MQTIVFILLFSIFSWSQEVRDRTDKLRIRFKDRTGASLQIHAQTVDALTCAEKQAELLLRDPRFISNNKIAHVSIDTEPPIHFHILPDAVSVERVLALPSNDSNPFLGLLSADKPWNIHGFKERLPDGRLIFDARGFRLDIIAEYFSERDELFVYTRPNGVGAPKPWSLWLHDIGSESHAKVEFDQIIREAKQAINSQYRDVTVDFEDSYTADDLSFDRSQSVVKKFQYVIKTSSSKLVKLRTERALLIHLTDLDPCLPYTLREITNSH